MDYIGDLARLRLVLTSMPDELETMFDHFMGDILVTAFSDPSWTPLFVSIKGWSLKSAGRLIKDGQKIRVNGRRDMWNSFNNSRYLDLEK